jgi:hypothetical protein
MRDGRQTYASLDLTAVCVTSTPSRQKCPPCLMIFHVGQEQRRPGCFCILMLAHHGSSPFIVASARGRFAVAAVVCSGVKKGGGTTTRLGNPCDEGGLIMTTWESSLRHLMMEAHPGVQLPGVSATARCGGRKKWRRPLGAWRQEAAAGERARVPVPRRSPGTHTHSNGSSRGRHVTEANWQRAPGADWEL